MTARPGIALIALAGCGLAAASAGIVALDGGTMAVIAQQGMPFDFRYVTAPQGPDYPPSQSGIAATAASSGSATYTIARHLITLTTTFHRDGLYLSDGMLGTVSAFGSRNFTVDADSYDALSGQHALTGSQRIRMQVIFDGLTTGARAFRHYQCSENTPHEVLHLGQSDGEYSDLAGAPIGPLVAGHRDSLSFNYQIANPRGTDAGASSVGSLNVILCPEPANALLLALSMLGIRRRR